MEFPNWCQMQRTDDSGQVQNRRDIQKDQRTVVDQRRKEAVPDWRSSLFTVFIDNLSP